MVASEQIIKQLEDAGYTEGRRYDLNKDLRSVILIKIRKSQGH
jgi:hypothetical protein